MDPAAPTVFNHVAIPGFGSLPHFNIRNGNAEQAMSLLIKPTIAASYHWISITGMPPARAMEYADALVLEHIAHLTAHNPGAWTAERIRKAAIILGVTRAIATKYYELAETDIIPGERADSALQFRAAVAATEGAPAVPEALILKPGIPAATAQIVNTPIQYTELESAAIAAMIPAAIGIIPVQGYSLCNTQHHYISDQKSVSFKAFLAIEKQCWRSESVNAFFTTDEEMVRDLMWHKACHPVNLTIKTNTAQNEATKMSLVKAGAGAAASRLPATEPGVRAGEAYSTLFDTLQPFFAMFSGGIDDSHLKLALRTVKRLLPGEYEEPNAPGRNQEIPQWVVDRRTAGQWVAEIVNNSQAIAAHCFGFYTAMSEAGMSLGTGQSVDSLRDAFSLKKLAKSHIPSYTLGYHQYSDYVVAKNKLRSKAQFEAPIFQLARIS